MVTAMDVLTGSREGITGITAKSPSRTSCSVIILQETESPVVSATWAARQISCDPSVPTAIQGSPASTATRAESTPPESAVTPSPLLRRTASAIAASSSKFLRIGGDIPDYFPVPRDGPRGAVAGHDTKMIACGQVPIGQVEFPAECADAFRTPVKYSVHFGSRKTCPVYFHPSAKNRHNDYSGSTVDLTPHDGLGEAMPAGIGIAGKKE